MKRKRGTSMVVKGRLRLVTVKVEAKGINWEGEIISQGLEGCKER